MFFGSDVVRKSRVWVLILAICSVTLMVYEAKTTYLGMIPSRQWPPAVGYGLAPWLVGLMVAAIKEGWARIRKRNHRFGRSLLWATGVFMVIMVFATIMSAVRSGDQVEIRNDAMQLMGASVWVPGIAAYCTKYVEASPEMIEEAASWSRRHDRDLRKIIAVIKATGGLSKDEKIQIDQMAMQALKAKVNSQQDKKGYCKQVEMNLQQGLFDLDNRADIASALKRIRDF
ncbi:hypothetical protein [Thalassospira sp. TSL5-1]|uniref:hypothetical protein n=1 Tax=Thalassospira sp. TSL5-1 TaxID=1544451 RepID=UPI00093FA6AF|nr:hypothetical protein [Thalassospira sp. TSL5-1]OKH87409.1 hypothetical protein LF95_11370 [Thalassospira sp. TSL5-1]